MNQKQYFDALMDVELKCQTGDEKEFSLLEKQLEELYSIKPVRLKWFVVKAKLMLCQKSSANEIYTILKEKANLLINYESTLEFVELYVQLAQNIGDKVNEKRHLHRFNVLRGQTVESECDELPLLLSQYIQTDKAAFLEKIITTYFETENYIMYILLRKFCNAKYGRAFMQKFVQDMTNMGYLDIILSADNPIVIISETDNSTDCEILKSMFDELGKKIYYLYPPITMEEDGINIHETLTVSIDNIETEHNTTLIYPIEIKNSQGVKHDNRQYIIDYILKKEKQLIYIFSDGDVVDFLENEKLIQQKFHRMSAFQGERWNKKMAYGWFGKYVDYATTIYGIDVGKELEKLCEYDFSIVIPVRDSVDTLQYTIQTCLKQTYSGTYEILICDNSTEGNEKIFHYIRKLNNPFITYVRTPRELPLPKSFEFACLKAKGRFIITLGADDGLLPWCLSTIDQVQKKLPEEMILQWEKGFYAWPGFNKHQENKLVIPPSNKKQEYIIQVKSSMDRWIEVLSDSDAMYNLPMLYINSGFQRTYLKVLLDRTERLWDGACQDIYMGVLNLCINKNIVEIKYPLTIAGMSNHSIGARFNAPTITKQDEKYHVEERNLTGNVCGYIATHFERSIPEISTNVTTLYTCILRMQAIGLLNEKEVESLLNWQFVFINCLKYLNPLDIMYDKKLNSYREVAIKRGPDFYKWFNEKIFEQLMQPKLPNKDVLNQEYTKYKVGYQEDGSFVLDASQYHVNNILDAVKLFEEQMIGEKNEFTRLL